MATASQQLWRGESRRKLRQEQLKEIGKRVLCGIWSNDYITIKHYDDRKFVLKKWLNSFEVGMLKAMTEITEILSKIDQGDPAAAEELLPLVYDELRKLAAIKLSQEKPGQTLQATALVHDAWLRLVDVDSPATWDSRRHFFAAAAEAMRRILVESARRKKRQKHGGDAKRVELLEEMWISSTTPDQMLAVDESLTQLAEEDSIAAEVVKLRYFAGMSTAEAADALGIDRSTAHRHWTYARAWIRESVGNFDSG